MLRGAFTTYRLRDVLRQRQEIASKEFVHFTVQNGKSHIKKLTQYIPHLMARWRDKTDSFFKDGTKKLEDSKGTVHTILKSVDSCWPID